MNNESAQLQEKQLPFFILCDNNFHLHQIAKIFILNGIIFLFYFIFYAAADDAILLSIVVFYDYDGKAYRAKIQHHSSQAQKYRSYAFSLFLFSVVVRNDARCLESNL